MATPQPIFFDNLLTILGWQGGTIHQALAAVKDMKKALQASSDPAAAKVLSDHEVR